VPFSEDCGGVASILEHLTHGEGVCGERIRAAFDRDQRQAVADGVLARHQRGARGCAGWLDQELCLTTYLT